MRIVCTISIGNRLLSTLTEHKNRNNHVKSTLALCRHPKEAQQYLIILFTAQNKTGTKYKVTDNVKCILTKFINEGKATIQFKEPPHDFYIKADQIQLKGFLTLLKRALEKKISPKELTLSSMSVTAVKNIAPTKLVVRNRSELPKQGFPRTLESVFINDINLCKLSVGILQLQKLRVLDVSDNLIEYLPSELKNLPISELNVSQNQLFKSNLKQWEWIGGILLKTLKSINLSHNKLVFLPEKFVKFEFLVNINLNNNNLSALPAGFGNFRNLRTLNLAYNNLKQFPGSMKRLHLENLDVSHNDFKPINVAAVYPKFLQVCTLKESSARKVLHCKHFYTSENIPFTLVEYLDNAHYCVCGKACFEVHLHHANVLLLKSISQYCVASVNESSYVPVDCYYCSLRCFRRNTHIAMN